MQEEQCFKNKLDEIAASKQYHQLAIFRDPTLWQKLSSQDRELLADLFVEQGIEQLQKQAGNVLESFEIANQITPKNQQILWKQASALANELHHGQCLIHSTKILENIIALEPEHPHAWSLWGSVLIHLGIFFSEMHYFQEAIEKLEKAGSLQIDNASRAEILWQKGLAWFHLGKQSGEAVDFYNAIETLTQASELNRESEIFWVNFGDAYKQLGMLLQRPEMIEIAIGHYSQAEKLDPINCEIHLRIAKTNQLLFTQSNKEEHFNKANEAYTRAAELDQEWALIYTGWGELLLQAGKKRRDFNLVTISAEKFSLADMLEHDHPKTLSLWGEALTILGTHRESLEWLRDGETKILQSLELDPENSQLWHLYGTSLCELGRYFSDEEFYFLALEKFQKGLTLDPSSATLWHGLALAHLNIAELTDDIEMMQQALGYAVNANDAAGGKNSQIWNDWGVVLMKLTEMTNDKRDIRTAVEKFEQALQHDENDSQNPEWLYNYGCALDFLGDFEEDPHYYEHSILVLNRVVQLDPTFHYAKFNLGLSYLHLGEQTSDIEAFNKAVENFQEVIDRDDEDEMAWNELGLAYLNLAELMNDPHNPELSQKLFHDAEIKLLSAAALGSNQALYNLACLYSVCENFTASMHYIEKSEKQGSLPSIDELLHDEWLEPVRQTPAFKNFIHLLKFEG